MGVSQVFPDVTYVRIHLIHTFITSAIYIVHKCFTGLHKMLITEGITTIAYTLFHYSYSGIQSAVEVEVSQIFFCYFLLY